MKSELKSERRRLREMLWKETPDAAPFAIYFVLVGAGLVPDAPPELIELTHRLNNDPAAFEAFFRQLDEVCNG